MNQGRPDGRPSFLRRNAPGVAASFIWSPRPEGGNVRAVTPAGIHRRLPVTGTNVRERPWLRALWDLLRRPVAGRGNPWLGIPLADYEGHMSLPQVGQARLLAEILEGALRQHSPRSVAVIGCAGGNGFERIRPETTARVVAVDLNPAYVARVRERFASRLPGLEPIAGDIQSPEVGFAPVDLIFAGLLLEYVDPDVALRRFRSWLRAPGILTTVIQAECATSAAVTPSPFASLRTLAPVMRLVRPEVLCERAGRAGFREIARRTEVAGGGKEFTVQTFVLPGTDPGAPPGPP